MRRARLTPSPAYGSESKAFREARPTLSCCWAALVGGVMLAFTVWLEGVARADAAPGPSASTEQVLYTTVIPLLILFAIFYFLLIRPQTQKASELKRMMAGLKRNDEVVTNGGLIGRIVELGDKVVTLEIASNVRVRVERSQIAALSTYGKTAKSGKDREKDKDKDSQQAGS